MFSFLDKVEKSRKEWLKKPNPIPNRARYLNAKLNESLVTNQEPNINTNINTNTNTNTNVKQK
jgi:hypothetical protein